MSAATIEPPMIAAIRFITYVRFVLNPSSGEPTKVPALMDVPVAANATSHPGIALPATK